MAPYPCTVIVAIWVVVVYVPAAVAQQCRLCTKSENKDCLQGGLRSTSRIVTVDRHGPREHDIAVTVSIARDPEECWLSLHVPDGSPAVRVPVAGSRHPNESTNWRAQKSKHFKYNHLVFLSTDVDGFSNRSVFGLYRIVFSGSKSVYFFVKTPNSDDVAEASVLNNGSLATSVTTDFKHCLLQDFLKPEVRVECVNDTVDSNAMSELVSPVAYHKESDLVVASLDEQGIECVQKGHLLVHCLLPRLGTVVQMRSVMAPDPDTSMQAESHVKRGRMSVSTSVSVTISSATVCLCVVAVLGFLALRARRCGKWSATRPSSSVIVTLPMGTKCAQNGARLTVTSLDLDDVNTPSGANPRSRLPSIISRTLSFLSSSGSNTTATRTTNPSVSSNSSCPSEDMALLQRDCIQSWMGDRLFSFGSIEVGHRLGQGEHGVVYKGTIVDGTARWPVALKTVKPESEMFDASLRELLKEGEVMASLPYHDNIANLQGVALEDIGRGMSRCYLLLEYCGNGSLHRYLTEHRASFRDNMSRRRPSAVYGGVRNKPMHDIRLLLAWSHQIAKGMEFLASQGIVHGDLAARNVLLTEDLTAKISDFGLSHLLRHRQSASLRQKLLPERWMAPEVFVEFQVNRFCDIWSYAIVIWEMFEMGELPYRSLVVSSTAEFLDALHSGVRLQRPELCPKEVYDLMTRCWHLNPTERISFGELAAQLEHYLDPTYALVYQEAREEMLRRYNSVQQNSVYFRMTGNQRHEDQVETYVEGDPPAPTATTTSIYRDETSTADTLVSDVTTTGGYYNVVRDNASGAARSGKP